MGLPVTSRIQANLLLKIDPPNPPLTVNPSRWPHTYAYDFVRSNPEIVPEEAISMMRHHEIMRDEPDPVRERHIPSRAQAAGILNYWVEMLEGVQTKRDLQEQLALAYLIREGYQLPRIGEPLFSEVNAAYNSSGV